MLHLSSEKLRKGLVDCQKKLHYTFQSLGIEVELLRDSPGYDPSSTDAPLRSIWRVIYWVKYLLSDALQIALYLLKNIASPISYQEVHHIVISVLPPSLSQTLTLASKVGALESILSSQFHRLCNLYSICFSGVTKQRAEALTARLSTLFTKISLFEYHGSLYSSYFGQGNSHITQLPLL